MKIEWAFSEYAFIKAIEGIKNQDASVDFLGRLYIGHLRFDLRLVEYDGETGVVLDVDMYIGGVDAEYTNTLINNLPHGIHGRFHAITKYNVDNFKTLGGFRKYVENECITYITERNNETLVQKMNMNSIFDWSYRRR